MYAAAEASPEQFEAAIEEAKAEGNLSRRNVTAKVTGTPLKSKSKRPEILRKTRLLDPNRVIETTCEALEGSCLVLRELTDEHFASLDRADLEAWSSSLRKSLREIGGLRNRLEKELNQRD